MEVPEKMQMLKGKGCCCHSGDINQRGLKIAGGKAGGENGPLYLKQPGAMVETSLPGIWFAEGWGWEPAHNYALVVLATPSAFHPSVHAKQPPSHILSSAAGL